MSNSRLEPAKIVEIGGGGGSFCMRSGWKPVGNQCRKKLAIPTQVWLQILRISLDIKKEDDSLYTGTNIKAGFYCIERKIATTLNKQDKLIFLYRIILL